MLLVKSEDSIQDFEPSLFFFGRNNHSFVFFYNLVVTIFFFVELKRDFSQVFIVFAGLEPKSFKNLFPFWEDRPDVTKLKQEVRLQEVHLLQISVGNVSHC